jgi:hypothetical protein
VSPVKFLILLTILSGAFLVSAALPTQRDSIHVMSKPVSASVLGSNLYTQPESDLRVATNPYVTIEERYDAIAENDTFVFHVDPEDLSFRLEDKRSGYVWGSSFFIDYAETDDDDNPLYPDLHDPEDRGFRSRTWRAKAISPVWIGYYGGARDNPQFREESLFESDQSSVVYTPRADGFDARLTFGFSRIEMTLSVTLTSQGIDVSIPEDSITDGEDAALSRLSVYPFLGAVKKTRTPGYIFVPDGIGALIRFDKADAFTSIFEKPFGGTDPSSSREQTEIPETINEEKRLYADVYGIVHGTGQNAVMPVINEGGPYASLIIYPAGLTTDFFFAYASFTYRTVYRQPLNRSGTNSIVRLQDEVNPFDLDISYVFLQDDEADYVGMASAYRDHLVTKGVMDDVSTDIDASLHLDVIAAENKPSLFGRRTVIMTDAVELNGMIDALLPSVDHLAVTYRGYAKGGLGGSSLNELPYDKGLGSDEDIRAINDAYDIWHVIEPTRSYPGARGYNPYDLAVQRNLDNILSTDTYGTSYLMHPKQSLERVRELKGSFDALGITHIAFETIGSMSYGTYGDDPMSPHETIMTFQEMTGLFEKSAVFDANARMFSADMFFDFALYSSGRAIYSDTVPFLSIVLRGMKPVYGRYGNFFSNTENELLRLIDYGIHPSFVVTEASAYDLLDTSSQDIHTSEFDVWKDEILRQYGITSAILSEIVHARVTAREVLETGVVLVTYSNGVMVGINYTDLDYEGIIGIPARSAVLGGDL